jgi:hypothetical protein
MGVAGGIERMYDAGQFAALWYPPNSFSFVEFRKEKDHEFPRSSRLESYQLS